MLRSSTRLVYTLFFFSGAASLIYEIVWGRLLVLIFGSTTNSIVATISAFLGGLALGSFIFGKIADRLSPQKLIKAYSFLELGVGFTAAASFYLIFFIRNIYSLFSDGSVVDFKILFIKFFLSIFVLSIPTFLMGATLPILIKFLETLNNSQSKSISHLYAINTLGAVLGTLFSAFISIELFGLAATLFLAVFINLAIAGAARLIKVQKSGQKTETNLGSENILSKKTIFVFALFSLSGLISIAYEILWTRILTPWVGTFIYAFALILAVYLVGIAIGSFLFERVKAITKTNSVAFALTEVGIGFFALVSVYFTSNLFNADKIFIVPLVILPSTIFMGLSFPTAVALINRKESGRVVGLTYFGNTVGAIVGGFLASFFFIPKIGSSQSVILLSIFNFAIAFIILGEKKRLAISLKLLIIFLIVFTSWLFIFKRHSLYPNFTQWLINWAKYNGHDYIFKEDEVASVFAYHDWRGDQNLLIDGVPTTNKVIETKLIANIPIILHKNPQNILDIAFGMGTTFRSSLAFDIKTDVVELVPSVPQMMKLFYPDAEHILKNPNGRAIINDGRNYIFLTDKKYDIVTIDPPPPFNAAGTTVLYSKNFYQEISKKLNPEGIVGQWMWFGAREDDIAMATKSFTEIFPYIMVLETPSGRGGMFLEGSFSPIGFDQSRVEQLTQDPKIQSDFQEIKSDFDLKQIQKLVVGDRQTLLKAFSNYKPVTDNNPRTEYFLLRHNFKKSPQLENVTVRELLKAPRT